MATDPDKVREAIAYFRDTKNFVGHWLMTPWEHAQLLADRVEELEVLLAETSRILLEVAAENAKLRAALQAVREAYDGCEGECLTSTDMEDWWEIVSESIRQHVLPLTESES